MFNNDIRSFLCSRFWKWLHPLKVPFIATWNYENVNNEKMWTISLIIQLRGTQVNREFKKSTHLHLQESVSELPRQLRQLEQMRSERQEWAAALYPVTEQGLLDRFNPRPQSQRQTSPAVLEHSQTQAESFEPASSTQVDLPLHEPPTSPPRDTHASLDSASQPPVPAAVSDFREEVSVDSPPSLSVGRGRTEMDTMGRGRSFESLSPSLSQSFRSFRY